MHLLTLFALFWLGVTTLAAEARWKEQYANAPESVKQWYATQHNKKGGWCCDNADGHAFYGEYAVNDDGSVEFDADGKHHKLPDYMVLDGPNPTGHAVWWYAEQPGGAHHDYCFARGAEG